MAHIPTSVPATSGDGQPISDEEHKRRKDLLKRILAYRQKMTEERGGVPIPREVIDKALDEVRGGSA